MTTKALGICIAIVWLGLASNAIAQDAPFLSSTRRPVIRGRQAAVSSMKAEATEAARRILEEGGNAFDAAVGGQAALAVTAFPRTESAAMPLCSSTRRVKAEFIQ